MTTKLVIVEETEGTGMQHWHERELQKGVLKVEKEANDHIDVNAVPF